MVDLKLGNEPTGEHGNTNLSIRGLRVLKEFFASKNFFSEEAEPLENFEGVRACDNQEWKRDNEPTHLPLLGVFSDIGQKIINYLAPMATLKRI